MATGVPNVSNNDAFAARNFAIEVDGTMIAQFTELSGLTSEIVSMELYKWHKAALDGKVKEARKNGSVILYDYQAGEIARWNFINAWPSKLSTGSLKAGSNDVVTEEATIVMEGFERVK
ncbi:MAG: phage tail protein [Chloroflexi bacterium]|nr:MAG: phage tail protein [Chloroflexota bacterium]